MIVHLGDCISDIQTIKAKFPQYEYEYVPGNCDFSYTVPEEKMIEVAGKKILLTHSFQYDTYRNLTTLYKNTENSGADIVLFGHTHEPFEGKQNGILYLNPGCISRPRSKDIETYLELTIESGKVSAKFHNADNK